MKRTTLQNLNKDRFTFMFASLVGRPVTVKLRNLASYEGVFSGCNLDKGEYTILLNFARELASETRPSGPVHDQMIIPGKEVVMMNGMDVPEEVLEQKSDDKGAEFKTDVDISTKRFSTRGERHLQSWADLQEDNGHDMELEGAKSGWSGANDQFEVAKRMGVVSTYKEDLYTTPLDYSSLTSEQRARAEKLAKEIEGGRNYSSQEEGADDADEEAKFSAVIGTGGYKKQSPAKQPGHPSNTAASWRRDDDSSNTRSGANTRLNALNLEPASSRSPELTRQPVASTLKTSTLPQIPPRPAVPAAPTVVSEMKGINALNLEPASMSRGAGTARGAAGRQPAQPTKRDFEIALAEIKSREQRNTPGPSNTGSSTPPSDSDHRKSHPAAYGKGKGGKGGVASNSPTDASSRASKFSFNPNASTFTPGGTAPAGNTLSIAITPGGSLSGTLKSANYDYYEPGTAGAPPAQGGQQGVPQVSQPVVQPPPPMAPMPMHPGMVPPPPPGAMMMFPGMMPPPHQFGMMMPPPQPVGPPPAFSPLVDTNHLSKLGVGDMVNRFVERSGASSSSFEWSTEPGPSYKEILGPLPTGVAPHPMMGTPMMPGAPGAFPMPPQHMMMAPGYAMPPPYNPYYSPRPPRGGPPGAQFMPQYPPAGYMAVPPPHAYRGGPYRGGQPNQGPPPIAPTQSSGTPQE